MVRPILLALPLSQPYRAQTATADADYVPVKGALHFAEGEVSKTIEITIIDDDEFEKDEEFTVVLTEPSAPRRQSRGA